ncbi:MAE_28990/MAE_18760 family HEPN-like nuclease [Empedobacter sp.]|uniref:MAE_28990/MAE_18760 family HEPN-like nuclease n=1 Tax=Empedobacter sp. TaxID=1927715 RepID=UPI0028A9429E|nr:MAE_28990/MAE_18760 family HEPN-like nuclease [Empedobacter sp.]
MEETKQIVLSRKNEINNYFDYINSINEDDFDKTVFKILKANLLLMLYNFVESVVSNSIDAIRNNIYHDSETNFDCLKNEIKIQILKDLKTNSSPEEFVKSCALITKDIIKLSFKKEKISKGNIDREIISELSGIYGFNIKNSNYQETGHGESLTTIKMKRNDLAHGTFSFAEIGKEYTVNDLEKIKNETINYLIFIVGEIEDYLENKRFIHSN